MRPREYLSVSAEHHILLCVKYQNLERVTLGTAASLTAEGHTTKPP
ncbi:hypothetical protein PS718_00512 [Pseudomonas fluorescens]|uniref:Uncharacterized protein n=1 Tax=Pseudomonas fluorescens TaxID=294 RepID=A0A5E7A396_PSEFL|nr:hypothetical protein PS718_00512 [Pseudomonas fluorescens]